MSIKRVFRAIRGSFSGSVARVLALVCALTACPELATSASISHPPFALQQSNSVWRLISPDGRPFFSLGVCVTTRGASRTNFDAENPGYASWQHYSNDTAWANTTLRRVGDIVDLDSTLVTHAQAYRVQWKGRFRLAR